MHGHQLHEAREAAGRISLGADRENGGPDLRGRFATGRCQRALPATPRRFWSYSDTYLSVPARSGTTSICSARRPSQRGMGNTKVPAALKLLPALDPNPTLSCNSPLCCGHRCFSSRIDRCAHALLRRPPGQGVRVRLGSELGPGRWHIHSPPPGPWQVLQICFGGVAVLLCLLCAHPLATTRKTTGLTGLWMIQFSSVGPLFCARVLS